MALESGDFDLSKTWLRTINGGNGDYYIQIIHEGKDGLKDTRAVRVLYSGGNVPSEIKLLISKLHWEMEKNNLNEFPIDFNNL